MSLPKTANQTTGVRFDVFLLLFSGVLELREI